MKGVNGMTVMIDTNIILDYVLKRNKAEEAKDCIEFLTINKNKMCLTSNVITDIYFITQREKDHGFAREVITKLLNVFEIANVDKNDCVTALRVDMKDYEDALLSVCAKKMKADCIITQNTVDFKNSAVPAMKPLDFLEAYKK